MMWWAFFCAVVVANSARATAAPSSDAMPQISPLDLIQIDPPAPDDESLNYVESRARFAGAPWLYNYLLADLSHDGQILVNKKDLRDMRTRRGFSVNPPVETLQRSAYNSYLGRLAHSNREFLNCVGKRDPWSSNECKTKNFLENYAKKMDLGGSTKSDY